MQPAIEPAANVLVNVPAEPAAPIAEPEIEFEIEYEIEELEPCYHSTDEGPKSELRTQWEAEHPDEDFYEWFYSQVEVEEALYEQRNQEIFERARQETELHQQERHNQILQAIEQWADEDDEDEYNEINAPTNSGQCEMLHQC
jgi:hypothetical protein